MNIQEMIEKECDDFKKLLLSKNKKYGNAALEPKRIFSQQDSIEQIKVRIDDKLSRIQNLGINEDTNDTILDLIGYLILLRVSLKLNNKISDDIESSIKDH